MKWVKERAFEHNDKGDIGQMVTGLVNDLGKHETTKSHPLAVLGLVVGTPAFPKNFGGCAAMIHNIR